MSARSRVFSYFKSRCFGDEDFYAYLTRSRGTRSLVDLERHLTCCSYCQDRLSGIRELVETVPEESQEEFNESTPQEIEETLALIARTNNKDMAKPTTRKSWYWSIGVAASLLALFGLGTFAVIHFMNMRKAEAFFAKGRALVEQNYRDQSPSGLRLALPFTSKATLREPEDSLDDAEHLFYQSLALKEGMREAHFGLGYIYLSKGHFSKARQQFQTILDHRVNDSQALLGRGVSIFEEGTSLEDPLARRNRLEAALADFDSVLEQDRNSLEALYNWILTLAEIERKKEALLDIDRYLQRDPDSLSAERLRDLRSRILHKTNPEPSVER